MYILDGLDVINRKKQYTIFIRKSNFTLNHGYNGNKLYSYLHYLHLHHVVYIIFYVIFTENLTFFI